MDNKVDERARSTYKKDDFDFRPMQKGITLLKFGSRGPAHEKVFKLSGDRRFITWEGRWFSPKFGKRCVVDLEKAIRLQAGQMTYKFERLGHAFGLAKEKSFSILYADGEKGNEVSLDLIAPTASIYKYWFKGIKKILERIQDVRANSSPDELFIKQAWEKADRDHNGVLSFGEIIKLVVELNINMPKSSVRTIFEKVDLDGSGQLNIDEFIDFVKLLRERPELDYLWSLILADEALPDALAPFPLKKEDMSGTTGDTTKKTITMEKFLKHWTAIQGETLDPEDAFDMLTSAHKSNFRPAYGDADVLTLQSFNGFEITRQMWKKLMSNTSYNEIFETAKRVVYQDMTLPLSAYYMASSHNTYLEGDQLTSNSSINRYISDLLAGCRCVELDCWDGDGKEPVIYHGFTLTSRIFFKDVIEAIAQYAFQESPYPVVLSIENHCGLEQQQRMAFHMKTIFKGMLLMPQTDITALPSPEDLREKIILKGKRDTAQVELDNIDEDENDEAELPDSEVTANPIKKTKKHLHSSKIHQDLSAITYLGTSKIREFNERTMSAPADLMSSYSENHTNTLIANEAQQKGWIKHNETHLSRIYPKGTRVDSSNYNPAPAWAAGAQLVALNYQTRTDVNTMANTGKFRENGSCGYVLKPPYLRTDVPMSPPVRLTVHVISGQQLPKPGAERGGEIIDPYIVLSVIGVAEDTKDVRTATINDNGFNPSWNEVFYFDVMNPDVAVLTLQCYDEDITSSEFIGFSALPVSCIRDGVRTIGLCDRNGQREREYSFATLFVRISTAPLPDTKAPPIGRAALASSRSIFNFK